jgi:hypothetical protein
MDLYTVLLFLHFLGVFALVSAFAVQQRALPRLRNARTAEQARLWLSLLASGQRAYGPAAAFLVLSGLWMAYLSWGGLLPWMTVSLFALAGIEATAFTVVRKQLKSIARELERAEGAELLASASPAIANPRLGAALMAMNLTVFATVFVMIEKPEGLVASVVLVAGALLGAALGFALSSRHPSPRLDEAYTSPSEVR